MFTIVSLISSNSYTITSSVAANSSDTGNGGSGSYLRFGDGNGERLRITADGEIQCRGAADNKGFAVYLDGTRRVSELIEHSSDG